MPDNHAFKTSKTMLILEDNSSGKPPRSAAIDHSKIGSTDKLKIAQNIEQASNQKTLNDIAFRNQKANTLSSNYVKTAS